MNLSVAPAQFTEGEALELTDYRPVNRFALLSAILGGLSGLALLSSLLLALPLFGLASGLCAYWQLSAPNSTQSGKPAAKWGIFLSLAFGLWVVTASLSKEQLIATQARTYAMQWFELLRSGKLQEAHQLTLHHGQRVQEGQSLDQFYEIKSRPISKSGESQPSPEEMNEMMEQTGYEMYQQFFKRVTPKRLMELGARAKYEYLQTVSQIQAAPTELRVTQHYTVTPERPGDFEPFVLQITFERSEINRIANWTVDDDMMELPAR